MASLRLSHSDQHGLALPGETHTDQVHLFIATVDPEKLVWVEFDLQIQVSGTTFTQSR